MRRTTGLPHSARDQPLLGVGCRAVRVSGAKEGERRKINWERWTIAKDKSRARDPASSGMPCVGEPSATESVAYPIHGHSSRFRFALKTQGARAGKDMSMRLSNRARRYSPFKPRVILGGKVSPKRER